jgi:hypothetical protein
MSAELAVQKAIYDALQFNAAVDALVGDRIYDRVPANATMPYVHIRSLQAVDDGSDCVDAWEIFVDIDAWDNGVGKPGASNVVSAVRMALHEVAMSLVEPYSLIAIDHRDSAIDTEADGLTTRGRMTFRTLVERIS